MRFSSFLAATSALFTLANCGYITFVNQDPNDRKIVFTTTVAGEEMDDLDLPGLAVVNQTFSHGWTGNFYTHFPGEANIPGILGEVTFDSWGGNCFFDISAILAPNNNDGVKMMFPLGVEHPNSGCQSYPGCLNAYNHWDDDQTRSTTLDHFLVLVGNETLSSPRQSRSACES